ncbi:hypothetical protein ABZU88_27880, partial [Streptomyces sp. NPDC005245]|uniref:hypothetical protein n=1 Tax=Streptomyces sp. NPDC005245 TaxID=3157029 RepID=UPI0033AE6D96
TASRETDKLAGELCDKHPELKLTKVMVSEAGESGLRGERAGGPEKRQRRDFLTGCAPARSLISG